jgi:hypothetical protein
MHEDIQVAGRAAARAGLAFTGHTDAGAVIDALGHIDVQRLLFFDEAGTAEVLAAFDEALAATDTPNLFLASMDILDFPGIFAVLDRVRDAGRRAVISTPGLAAADPALVARLAQYPVEMALTWLASDEPTYERVGGRADAHKLIPQAIENLRAAGIPYTLQTVVTSDNVHQFDTVIADVVQRFGQTQLRVHLFYPDLQGQGSSDYLDQFPAMTLVRAALERASAAQLSPRPRLVIGNMPLCQLDLRDLPGLDVVTAPYRAGHNPMGYRTVAACRSCRLVDRCIGVHPSQPERTPMLPWDDGIVAFNEAMLQDGGDVSGRVLPSQGVPRGQYLREQSGPHKPDGHEEQALHSRFELIEQGNPKARAYAEE